MVSVTGNARSTTATANANVQHTGPEWILSLKALAIYGQSRSPDTGITTVSAENASLFLRGDRRFDPRFSMYLLLGVETDHPKSIEERYSQELGVGYAWIDLTQDGRKLFLRSDAGFRMGIEYRFQYFPVPGPVDPREFILAAPRVAFAFHYDLSKTATFTEDLEVLSNVGQERWFANSIAKVSVSVVGPTALSLGYTINYDSAPPPPKLPWDTILAVTLDYVL